MNARGVTGIGALGLLPPLRGKSCLMRLRTLTRLCFGPMIDDQKSGTGMPFDGRLLAGVSVLAAVIESGSFVRAAEMLGISASGVSRAIARLEARIGVRLLDRTTR